MRFALVLTLLLAAVAAHSATISRTSIACPDGTYTTTATTAGCLPYISSAMPGANVAQTTTDYDATVSVTSGTFYACLFPSETVTPPTAAQIQAGSSPCINAGGTKNISISSTSVSLTGGNQFTGQTAEDLLKGASFVRTGVRESLNVHISSAFAMLAATGGGGTDLTGAGLFVCAGDAGNTDETPTGTAGTATSGCTSMAGACSAYSQTSPGIGQDVYFCEGGALSNTNISVSTGGNSGDQAVYGCYFDEGDDDGNPVLCTSF